MNNKLSTTYFILMIAPLFFGCGGPVTGGNKNKAPASSSSLHVGDEKYFILDMKESVVDMNTIEDGSHRSDNNLIKHLKDADFFDVKKFPFSTIAITRVASINVEDREITGNLTIKGITHPATFPARIEVKGGVVKANGKLVIDRTLWDVRYKSGKFFDNLKDQAIADSIEFNIKIVAKQ